MSNLRVFQVEVFTSSASACDILNILAHRRMLDGYMVLPVFLWEQIPVQLFHRVPDRNIRISTRKLVDCTKKKGTCGIQAVVTEAYRGASKMGKGKKLKSSNVTADFEKFENFFYQTGIPQSRRITWSLSMRWIPWSRSLQLRTWCSGTHLPYLTRRSQTLTSWNS